MALGVSERCCAIFGRISGAERRCNGDISTVLRGEGGPCSCVCRTLEVMALRSFYSTVVKWLHTKRNGVQSKHRHFLIVLGSRRSHCGVYWGAHFQRELGRLVFQCFLCKMLSKPPVAKDFTSCYIFQIRGRGLSLSEDIPRDTDSLIIFHNICSGLPLPRVTSCNT